MPSCFLEKTTMKFQITMAAIMFVFTGAVLANQDMVLSADDNIKVVGIAGLTNGGGMAMISVNGQPEKTVVVGSALAPGVTLYKVYTNKVAIQNHGAIQFYPLTAGQPYIPPEPIDILYANGQSRKIMGLPPEPENDLLNMQEASSSVDDYYLEPGQSRLTTENIPEQTNNLDETEMEAMALSEYSTGQSRKIYAVPVEAALHPEGAGIEE